MPYVLMVVLVIFSDSTHGKKIHLTLQLETENNAWSEKSELENSGKKTTRFKQQRTKPETNDLQNNQVIFFSSISIILTSYPGRKAQIANSIPWFHVGSFHFIVNVEIGILTPPKNFLLQIQPYYHSFCSTRFQRQKSKTHKQ